MISIKFPSEERAPSRDGVGKALEEIGEDPNIWVLTADVAESTRVHWFAKKYPSRFIQVGVAEQNMVGVAVGIASCGKTAFVSSYGVFTPGRNLDQIRISVCYNDVPVIFHGSHTGLNVGPDGASHQALEDIAIVRSLPNMIVVAPADFLEAKKATKEAIRLKKPLYIRTSREKTPIFTTENTPFEIGKMNVIRDGNDITIVACGAMVYEALRAADSLKDVDAEVINLHTIKPIDKLLVDSAKKTGLVVTVEEHQIYGGMGSAVAELLSQHYPVPMRIHGVYDMFCESGEMGDLWKKYKLDWYGIVSVVRDAMKMKRR